MHEEVLNMGASGRPSAKCSRVVCYVFVLVGFLSLLEGAKAYKHVIWMHGIFAGPSEFDDFKNYISKVSTQLKQVSILKLRCTKVYYSSSTSTSSSSSSALD